VGLVLIDGKGFMLYAFVPDKRGAVCAGSCVASWPPFTLTREHVLDASPILNIERFAIEPKEHYPEGARVVSYAGWLLHSFVGDTSPGVARGQGLHSDGGHWYLILPSGKLVTTAV
jgi:predicted lipoprotein with Yx(FWY)xxD motif